MSIPIGIDVGNRNTKTSSHVFSSGVIECKQSIPFNTNVLVIGDKWYSVGTEKLTVKSQSEDEYTIVRYLAAIAKEVRTRLGGNMVWYEADVVIGAGVYFSGIGIEGKN